MCKFVSQQKMIPNEIYLSQERCDHGLMSKRAETLETETNTSSPDWWQCIEEI